MFLPYGQRPLIAGLGPAAFKIKAYKYYADCLELSFGCCVKL
jgi:hypothetical protein